jgi:hypothetical protein
MHDSDIMKEFSWTPWQRENTSPFSSGEKSLEVTGIA